MGLGADAEMIIQSYKQIKNIFQEIFNGFLKIYYFFFIKIIYLSWDVNK